MHLMREAGTRGISGLQNRARRQAPARTFGMVAQGHRAVMVFLVQRGDAESFRLAGDTRPGLCRGISNGGSFRRRNALLHDAGSALSEIDVERRMEIAELS